MGLLNYDVPEVNGIIAGDWYLVARSGEASGNAYYNSITYPDGSEFQGVEGVNDYTKDAGIILIAIAKINGVSLEHDLGPDKFYPDELAITGISMEYIHADATFVANDFIQRYLFKARHQEGSITGATSTVGGTVVGTKTEVDSQATNEYFTYFDTSNPVGTISNQLNCTIDRAVTFETNITDGSIDVLIADLLRVEIFEETPSLLRIKIRSEQMDLVDITITDGVSLYSELNIPVSQAGTTLSRNITAAFTVNSELIVKSKKGTDYLQITFKLLP